MSVSIVIDGDAKRTVVYRLEDNQWLVISSAGIRSYVHWLPIIGGRVDDTVKDLRALADAIEEAGKATGPLRR